MHFLYLTALILSHACLKHPITILQLIFELGEKVDHLKIGKTITCLIKPDKFTTNRPQSFPFFPKVSPVRGPKASPDG